MHDWHARFKVHRTITHPSIGNDVISSISYSPRPESLAVLTKGNALLLFSLSTYELRRSLTGFSSQKSHIKCEISPCGQYVMSGSDEGRLMIWDIASGKLLQQLTVYASSYPASSTSITVSTWNPRLNVVAAGAFGAEYPIILYEGPVASPTAFTPTASSSLGSMNNNYNNSVSGDAPPIPLRSSSDRKVLPSIDLASMLSPTTSLPAMDAWGFGNDNLSLPLTSRTEGSNYSTTTSGGGNRPVVSLRAKEAAAERVAQRLREKHGVGTDKLGSNTTTSTSSSLGNNSTNGNSITNNGMYTPTRRGSNPAGVAPRSQAPVHAEPLLPSVKPGNIAKRTSASSGETATSTNKDVNGSDGETNFPGQL